MSLYNHYSCLLIWLCFVYFFGVLFFTKGFLLKRLVIDKKTYCQVNTDDNCAPSLNNNDYEYDHFHDLSSDNGEHIKDICWLPKRYNKSIIIVIDALRFDFIKFVPDKDNLLLYQNKMRTINYLLHKKPYQSKLYQFIADPPTTTMQRLKGLTTGSLPTFVDAGANFASSEITEDNIIDQLRMLNKKIIFMGDDTWSSLFPDRFERSYYFPSFDVKDLHSVDDGISRHLIPEIRKLDWDIIIAHYLGVDHCGHRYGPEHPAMEEKLIQMDKIIR